MEQAEPFCQGSLRLIAGLSRPIKKVSRDVAVDRPGKAKDLGTSLSPPHSQAPGRVFPCLSEFRRLRFRSAHHDVPDHR
jgi:hypothetical protein